MEITLHFMWGIWDETPFPYVNQVENICTRLGYSYKVHSKNDIENLVDRYANEFNIDIIKAYYKIQRKVSRADIGRYLVIFYYSGIYLDNDAILTQQLTKKEYLNEQGVWFTEKRLRPDMMHKLGHREAKYSHRIANYAFGCHKIQSLVMKKIIDEAIARTLKIDNPWTDKDVIYCTGPDVITTLYHRTKLFSKAHPKKYVKHKAHGSWKAGKDCI